MEGSPCIGGVLGRAGEELSLLQVYTKLLEYIIIFPLGG